MNKKKSHVKIGDKIKILTGAERGFIGKISKIFKQDSLAIIEELVPKMKYIRNAQEGQPNKREIQKKIHISNLMLWDEKNQEASRIGYKEIITALEKKKKIRYFKKSGNCLEN